MCNTLETPHLQTGKRSWKVLIILKRRAYILKKTRKRFFCVQQIRNGLTPFFIENSVHTET